MSKVPVVLGVLVFIASALHTLIFRNNFQHNIYLYFPIAVIIGLLVISGVISESHFQDFPSLMKGIGSIFGIS